MRLVIYRTLIYILSTLSIALAASSSYTHILSTSLIPDLAHPSSANALDYGRVGNVFDCQIACTLDPLCAAYTYIDDEVETKDAGKCFGVIHVMSQTDMPWAVSGLKHRGNDTTADSLGCPSLFQTYSNRNFLSSSLPSSTENQDVTRIYENVQSFSECLLSCESDYNCEVMGWTAAKKKCAGSKNISIRPGMQMGMKSAILINACSYNDVQNVKCENI